MDSFNEKLDSNTALFQRLSNVRICTTVRELNTSFPGGIREGLTLEDREYIEGKLQNILRNMESLGASAREELEKRHPELAERAQYNLTRLAAMKSTIDLSSSDSSPEMTDFNIAMVLHQQYSNEPVYFQPEYANYGLLVEPRSHLAQLNRDGMIPDSFDWTENESNRARQTMPLDNTPTGYRSRTGFNSGAETLSSQKQDHIRSYSGSTANEEDGLNSPTPKPTERNMSYLTPGRMTGRALSYSTPPGQMIGQSTNTVVLNSIGRAIGLRDSGYAGDTTLEMIRDS